MTQWNSLYIPCAENKDVINALQAHLKTPDYERYDPFGLIPGKSYERTIKLFVSPVKEGWTRLLVGPDASPDLSTLQALSAVAPVLSFTLTGDEAEFLLVRDGERVELTQGLGDYLKTDIEQLESALNLTVEEEKTQRRVRRGRRNKQDDDTPTTAETANVAISALPADLQAKAEGLNPRAVNALFKRLTNKSLDIQQQKAVYELMKATNVNWESVGGQRIRAVMACINMPESWLSPDYVALRDAYQLQLRKQRRPNATMLPGDEEALQAVPDALDYQPIFAGILNEKIPGNDGESS